VGVGSPSPNKGARWHISNVDQSRLPMHSFQLVLPPHSQSQTGCSFMKRSAFLLVALLLPLPAMGQSTPRISRRLWPGTARQSSPIPRRARRVYYHERPYVHAGDEVSYSRSPFDTDRHGIRTGINDVPPVPALGFIYIERSTWLSQRCGCRIQHHARQTSRFL